MTKWTPAQSSFLSLLLEDVVGTSEMVRIRQDYYRIMEEVRSNTKMRTYITGSKAEGLDLPGSDVDVMYDTNEYEHINVIQDVHEMPSMTTDSVLLFSTDKVPIGFAMLKILKLVPRMTHQYVKDAYQEIDGSLYFSSFLYVHNMVSIENDKRKCNFTRTGPSVETTRDYDENKPPDDNVMSIHCAFWPSVASEWRTRPRRYGWPRSADISSIVDFGYHLVPTCHPNSPRNMMEWRISFSVAERTLVWSFNHVQIQCYAVMKLILKEFINVKYRELNPAVNGDTPSPVLCSYFIKTLLFWAFEETDPSFWCADNLAECVSYLLRQLYACIRHGVIKHYFFPAFNLLSIKLTTNAQNDLLRILGDIIYADISMVKPPISILLECKTLHEVYSKFEYKSSYIENKDDIMKNDDCLLTYLSEILLDIDVFSLDVSTRLFCNITCSSPLIDFAKRLLFLKWNIKSLMAISKDNRNRRIYTMCRSLKHNIYGIDISTSRFWYAMFLVKSKDFNSTLCILSDILSRIPPYCLYKSNGDSRNKSNETKAIYTEAFADSQAFVMERARTAWMLNLHITKNEITSMPHAIQIELSCCDLAIGVNLSPYTCAFYLMFLCHHELREFEQRDNALRQLIDITNDQEQVGVIPHHSFNLAGHCLLMAGETTRARDMFLRSYHHGISLPPHDKYNSAVYYLQSLPP